MEPSELNQRIDKAVAYAMGLHDQRADGCAEVPLRRRGRRLKKRPNISLLLRLIANAEAERSLEAGEPKSPAIPGHAVTVVGNSMGRRKERLHEREAQFRGRNMRISSSCASDFASR